MGPYLCLLLRMYCAYADWGFLNFIYLMCSWYLCLRLVLFYPTYAICHGLHVSLYIPLLSICFELLVCFCFMSCWIVLVVLNAIPMLVCLKRFVVFLIFGPMYMTVVHILFLSPKFSSWLGFLCLIFLFRLNIIFLGKLLFCAISCINVHSVCFHSSGSGKECILVMCYL